MGAVPKQRISRSQRGKRRANQKVPTIHIVECPNCHNPKLPHRACPFCGRYKGREVIEVVEE